MDDHSSLPAAPWLREAAAQNRSLKIKRIDAHVLQIGGRKDVVCARVETVDGLHGWGEGTTPPDVTPVSLARSSLNGAAGTSTHKSIRSNNGPLIPLI